MPTYEYQCTRCSHVFEEFKPISAPPRERCPKCRGKVERLISGGLGMVFKGSGFYVNDSRGGRGAGDGKSAAGDTSTGSGTGAAEGGGGTDGGKQAKKPDTK
jgi:putative FmdB family regulatory protein